MSSFIQWACINNEKGLIDRNKLLCYYTWLLDPGVINREKSKLQDTDVQLGRVNQSGNIAYNMETGDNIVQHFKNYYKSEFKVFQYKDANLAM